MNISLASRFGAISMGVLILFVGSFSMVSAASTVVENAVKGFVACETGGPGDEGCTGSGGHADAFSFADPDITVQYQAQVTDASGQVIAPGGSVSCGEQITLQCLPHNNNDIDWFSAGGIYDSPYGTWETPSSSCTEQYYVTEDLIGRKGDIYANLSLQYPTQNVSGTTQLTNCHTLSDGCSMTCTAVNTGTAPVSDPIAFNYSSTPGSFYGSVRRMDNPNPNYFPCVTPTFPLPIVSVPSTYYRYLGPTSGDGQVFYNEIDKLKPSSPTTVTIPAATIPYPITVTPSTDSSSAQCAPSTTATNTNTNTTCTGSSCNPSAPTISSVGSQTCTLNTAFTINFTANDPQNQAILYQVSWDGDGTVNQVVPASGYVPSGTTESATRTYTMAGPETVEVRAVNSSGAISPWTTFTFNCSAAASTGQPNQCTAGNVCQGSKLCQQDASCNVDPNSCQTCQYGCGNNACLPPPAPTLSLTAIPSLVEQGSTTAVTWSAQNVTSCNVSGNNGDGAGSNATGLWSCTGSACASAITQTSSPIQDQTIYTMMCTALDDSTSSKQAVVNVVATFHEQ